MVGGFHHVYARNRRMTGKVQFRKKLYKTGWFSGEERVVLYLEWQHERCVTQVPRLAGELPATGWHTIKEWLPAEPLDLTAPALRWLFDQKEEPDA